jgi:hypothetical protein
MAHLAGAHGLAHNHRETETEINQALDTGAQPLTGFMLFTFFLFMFLLVLIVLYVYKARLIEAVTE